LRHRDNYPQEALLFFFLFFSRICKSYSIRKTSHIYIHIYKIGYIYYFRLVLFKCSLQSSTSDDQLLLTNESYFSFEEIKSYESESLNSTYYSPNSSLVDIENMVQEFDEINLTNNNSNNTSFNEGKHDFFYFFLVFYLCFFDVVICASFYSSSEQGKKIVYIHFFFRLKEKHKRERKTSRRTFDHVKIVSKDGQTKL